MSSGRASLIKRMQEQQRAPGGGGDGPQIPVPQEPPPPTEVTMPKLGGRGAMFRKLAQMPAPSTEIENTLAPSLTPVETLAPVPKIGGRGALFARVQQSPQATVTAPEPPPPISTSAAPPAAERAPPSTDTSVDRLSEGVKRITLAPRPPDSRGNSGDSVGLSANYIPLYLKPGRAIFEYEVRFNPSIDDKQTCEKIMYQQHRELFQGRKRTFDGVTMYVPEKFPQDLIELTGEHPITNETHKIVITFKRERGMTECTHMYNVLFNRIQEELKLTRLKRGEYFSQQLATPIPQHRLEVWPGYVTTVDTFDQGILLNCNVSSKVLRTMTVMDLIHDLTQGSGSRDWKDALQRSLIGQSVMIKQPVKLYRVDDIDFTKTPMSTFQKSDGTEMSYVEYHRRKGIEIRDLHQPMLIHKPKPSKRGGNNNAVLMLIPELCFLTGLTDEMRADFKVMKDVAVYTRLSPNHRMAMLRKFINNIKENPNCVRMLDEWGLQVPDDTIKIDARCLRPEKILFCNKEFAGTYQADWSRAATTERMLHSINLDDWLVVHVQRDSTNANGFVDIMGKVCPQLGVNIKYPIIEKLSNDKTETYLAAIRRCLNESTQIVVIIFPTARDDRYAAVKKLLCVEKPRPSQVINSRTISRPEKMRSIVQKVALQINCKLGGSLWAVKCPLKRAMICGIDTYHDTKNKAQSVVGFVASMNPTFTRWHSQVFFQSMNREISDGLRLALVTALQKYAETNHCHPEQIIIYRDGVGDGQLKVCEQYEVFQLMKAFPTVDPLYNPQLTFVVCQKRVNTRIFLPKGREFENPVPGSIVDHAIVKRFMAPHWYDFYLVSQFVRQGTVTPTHYVVIHNTATILDADKLQKLTYKMCHLYYNWPGTIRVPAPCQYAHKLAHLVGSSIHKEPANILCDKLFFL